MTLYVGNLSYATTEAELRQAFAAFGEVANARIVLDRDTGRSRGYGFVDMASAVDAQAALVGLKGTTLMGRKIRVSEASAR